MDLLTQFSGSINGVIRKEGSRFFLLEADGEFQTSDRKPERNELSLKSSWSKVDYGMLMLTVATATPPSSSVTVRVTVYTSLALYACLTVSAAENGYVPSGLGYGSGPVPSL